MLYESPDNSPGICTTLSDYNEQGWLLYLELFDVKTGLRKYNLPQEKINQDKLQQEKCIKEEL